MVDRIEIASWCTEGSLPKAEDFFAALLDEGTKFTDIEGQNWDFKDQWPFSYSDKYFAGICRLICAFSNTSGGVIVFGVNDTTREGGKNKVRPNIDKLQKSFQQLTGSSFNFDIKTYQDTHGVGQVDALLIKARERQLRPFAFNKAFEGYQKGIIWVRSGHEVVRAQPQHYAKLFLSDQDDRVEGSIPPSSAQIKRFIGRAEVITELFFWIQNTDEPRTYVYGKGGSGKTTIAREFARLVKSAGGKLKIEGVDKVDIVIFLSAKERELVSTSAEILEINEPDFFDETSLLRKIIHFSGGEMGSDDDSSDDLLRLRDIVKTYFDNFSYLLVLDDIDTLTTKGIDPGADFLFRTLSRAQKRSKIIYTIRNAPSQSLHNSIEVPGLIGNDYDEFVNECVCRFNAPDPSKEFRNSRLPKLSERRPLVIESIIALSRTAGGYEGAERLFIQHVGDDVRDYVFSREWDALPNGLERPLLAALADLNRPVTFDELKIVLQSGDSKIQDSIGSVREMFLSVDDSGSQTLYSLAPLTRSFINSKKGSLKLYSAVKERVRNFKKSIKITSPEVTGIISKVRTLTPLRFKDHSSDNTRRALSIVQDTNLKESVTEDPVFRATKGFVEAIQDRPNMTNVREDFLYSLQMKHEPEIEELMAWFRAEKDSVALDEHLFIIVDTVISGRRYTEDEKIGMVSRKATTFYNLARQRLHTDPEVALGAFRKSLLLHFLAFKKNAVTGSTMLTVSEKYAMNTAHQWIRALESRNVWEPLSAMIELERDTDGYLDPIFTPFVSYLERIAKQAYFPAEKSRIHNLARKFLSQGLDDKKWMDTTMPHEITRSLNVVCDATRTRR